MSFKEKFYEEMYFKKTTLGGVKKTYSKPEDVTNISQTFGSPSSQSQNECLYDVILPAKSAEQVNKEYEAFHDKYIISHNHYFPSEQVNRRSSYWSLQMQWCIFNERLKYFLDMPNHLIENHLVEIYILTAILD